MNKLIKIDTLETFEKIKNENAIILFTANWCPDCLFIKPFMDDIVDANPEFTFYVIDRDEMIDLCKDLDILGIPSFLAYRNGEEIGRFVSKLRKTKEEIQAFISSVK